MKGISALLLFCATSHFAVASWFSAIYGLQVPSVALGFLGTKLLGIVVCVLSVTGSASSDSAEVPLDTLTSDFDSAAEDEETAIQAKGFSDMGKFKNFSVSAYGEGVKKSLCNSLCKKMFAENTFYDGPLSKSTEFATPDSPKFVYYRIEPETQGVRFKVKANNDAYIVLASGMNTSDRRYEVRIGILSNYQTFITKESFGVPVATSVTPKILSKDDFNQFWIKWDEGTIRIGKGGEKRAFLAYADPDLFEVRYLGFSTRWGSKGNWEVEKLVEVA